MSLYSYFAEASKRSDLSNPNGSLSASVSPAAIKEANEVVKNVSFARKLLANNSSPDVFVDVVTSHHCFH